MCNCSGYNGTGECGCRSRGHMLLMVGMSVLIVFLALKVRGK